jgi:hypothetical protein
LPAARLTVFRAAFFLTDRDALRAALRFFAIVPPFDGFDAVKDAA